jgi:hypothetical protein
MILQLHDDDDDNDVEKCFPMLKIQFRENNDDEKSFPILKTRISSLSKRMRT